MCPLKTGAVECPHARTGICIAAGSGRKETVMAAKKASSKRELIDTGKDKRYVRRDEGGKFKESDDVGRSLSQDRRKHAKTVVPKGQGDRGDQARSKRKSR